MFWVDFFSSGSISTLKSLVVAVTMRVREIWIVIIVNNAFSVTSGAVIFIHIEAVFIIISLFKQLILFRNCNFSLKLIQVYWKLLQLNFRLVAIRVSSTSMELLLVILRHVLV